MVFEWNSSYTVSSCVMPTYSQPSLAPALHRLETVMKSLERCFVSVYFYVSVCVCKTFNIPMAIIIIYIFCHVSAVQVPNINMHDG